MEARRHRPLHHGRASKSCCLPSPMLEIDKGEKVIIIANSPLCYYWFTLRL
jgi:hypothetical protein